MLKALLIMSVLLMLALCGCASTGEKSQIKEELKEAAGVTDTDWVERRKDTLLKAKEKLADIQKDTNRIQKAGSKMKGSGKIKAQFKEKWTLTQKALAEAEQSFQRLEKAEPNVWEQERQSFLSQMNVLENHFHQLRSMVK